MSGETRVVRRELPTITQAELREFNRTGKMPARLEALPVKTAADLLAEQEAAKTPFYSHLLKAEQATKRGGRFDGLAAGSSTRGQMNKTEARYGAWLEQSRVDGLVAWWRFEAIRLRVTDPVAGKAVWYTPDFWFAMTAGDGRERLVDVKGGVVNDASILRLKACAMMYPERRFFIAQWQTKKQHADGVAGWKITEHTARNAT